MGDEVGVAVLPDGLPLVPNALLPGDLAVWDGHVATVVGDGMMAEAGTLCSCHRSGPQRALAARSLERQPGRELPSGLYVESSAAHGTTPYGMS